MDWQEEYQRKLTTAEEAVKVVKSGDRVAVGGSIHEPDILPDALWERREELKDVKIIQLCPMRDRGWCQPGGQESFEVEVLAFIGTIVRHHANERRITFIPNGWHLSSKTDERAEERKDFDVFLVRVSPPNERGFCSFGSELWLKKDWARKAKKIIAEVDSNTRWVYGDSWIPVSEVDCFVEHSTPIMTDEELLKRVASIEPEEKRERILKYGLEALPQVRPRLVEVFESLDAQPSTP